MVCHTCQKNEAIIDPVFGVLPCKECQDRQHLLADPGNIPEFIGDNIKEQRKAHFDDIHGAHRKGVPSREFLEKYGSEAMRRQGFTDKEIKNAQPVWDDDKYYGHKNG
jgi:hypothetical protein